MNGCPFCTDFKDLLVKENIEFLTDHSVDPDKRRYAIEGEAECHYIDLDHYYKPGEDPYKILPKYWKEAVEKNSTRLKSSKFSTIPGLNSSKQLSISS